MVTSPSACGELAPLTPSEAAKEIELPNLADQTPEPAEPPSLFMNTQLEAEPGWKYEDLTQAPAEDDDDEEAEDEDEVFEEEAEEAEEATEEAAPEVVAAVVAAFGVEEEEEEAEETTVLTKV